MDDDGDDKDDTKRRTRNLSEKKRRDQFNMLVTELSTLVASNNRKMDKSTVLKSTISFLKNHNELTVRSRAHDVQEDWKPTFLSNEEFTYLVLEALEGFVMVFSASGRIYYASESIMSLLGHNPVDLVNKSIFDLTYEDDRPNLYNILQRNASGMEQIHNTSKENEIIRFQMHLRRGTLDFRDDVSYDLVQFYGHFRINQEQAESEQDMLSYQQDQESRVLFICIGRLHTPQLILGVSLVDSSRSEFTSRHSLEWKFLFLDHRAPPIIGYLPFEVLGTSGYDYYHFDDLEKVVTCHEALMQKGELTSCYYRFLTKGQQWIWLQTRFYITYHQWNSKPEFVVCTHQVVSHAEVAKSAKGIEDQDTVSEAEVVQNNMKETPSDEPMQALSPSFMSESTSEAFGNSFQQLSQKTIKDPPPDDGMPGLSPSYTTESANDAFGNTYQMVSQAPMIPLPTSLRRPDTPTYLSDDTKEALSATCRHMTSPNAMNGSPSDKQVPTLSPSYSLSEGPGDVFGNTYRANSLPTSVKSASGCSTATIATVATTGASWRALKRYTGSDTASLSGDSRDSQRNSERESHKSSSSILAPQHGIGAQYLDPSPYGAAGVGVPAILPISTVPVLVTPDQAQMQEQLQRKHEELQQMIVRQQEELRQVKEQLLLARLGILQPLINVPNHYSTPEEIQNQQRMAQLGYANAPPRPDLSGYGPQVPLPPMPPMPLSNMSSHPPQPPRPPHPPHPPRPPHPSNPHQQMPQ